MPAQLVPTPPTEIDHKLHRIVLGAASQDSASLKDLARTLETEKWPEFSYERDGKTRYTSVSTIAKYVSYARALNLLNDQIKPLGPSASYSGLAAFQGWLADKVITYLANNNCSITAIRQAMQNLLTEVPARLTTPDNVHDKIKTTISREIFKNCIKVVHLLRPRTLRLGSPRLIISSEVLKQ